MVEMRFKLAGRQPVPVAPGEAEGGDVETFSVDQTAKRVKWPKQALVSLWEAFFPPADDAGDDEPSPTAGGLPRNDLSVNGVVERAVLGWRDDPAKVLIRAADFGGIGDADLALFLARCAQRGLNPWRREVYPKFDWDERRQRHRLLLIVSIEKALSIAHATGQFAGVSAVRYEAADDGHPVVARLRVRRSVGGVVQAYMGEAYWQEYYPGPLVDSLWDRMPRMNLKRCALADGLRLAFPQLAGIYTSVEVSRAGPGTAAVVAGVRSAGRDDPDAQPFPDYEGFQA